jgi:hypothetical protein
MTRDDWIWVAVRIFGVYLVVMAVMTVPKVINGALSTWTWSGKVTFHEADTSDMSDMRLSQYYKTARAAAVTSLVVSSVRLVVFAIVGLYFLRNGRFVFRLVRPPAPALSPSPPPDMNEEDDS